MFASNFDFDLPADLIAQYPAEPRDRSRLMVIDRRRGTWEHRIFAELPELLDPRDVLVRNDTRVVPARLVGRREATGGRWEGLFLREQPGGTWEILAKTRGRPVPGEHVVVGQGLRLVLEARGESGRWIVRPQPDPDPDEATGDGPGAPGAARPDPPAPLYPPRTRGGPAIGSPIRRSTPAGRARPPRRRPGSTSPPRSSTGWPRRGIACVDLTLHVGLGTFRPIEADRLEDHVMHAEWAELSAEAVATPGGAATARGRIVAVGTTSARTLETAAASGTLRPFAGETRLFIRPGHVFRGLDALITNFHLPRSSLLVLVSALAGVDLSAPPMPRPSAPLPVLQLRRRDADPLSL